MITIFAMSHTWHLSVCNVHLVILGVCHDSTAGLS